MKDTTLYNKYFKAYPTCQVLKIIVSLDFLSKDVRFNKILVKKLIFKSKFLGGKCLTILMPCCKVLNKPTLNFLSTIVFSV